MSELSAFEREAARRAERVKISIADANLLVSPFFHGSLSDYEHDSHTWYVSMLMMTSSSRL
jgi:hypothetical protein